MHLRWLVLHSVIAGANDKKTEFAGDISTTEDSKLCLLALVRHNLNNTLAHISKRYWQLLVKWFGWASVWKDGLHV